MPSVRALAAAPFTRRSLAALLLAVVLPPLSLLGAVALAAGLLVGGVLSVTPLGLWLVALALRGALGLAAVHRGLARRLLGEQGEPPGPRRAGDGVFGRRRALLGDPAAWRAVAFLLAAPAAALLALPAWVAGYLYGPLLLGLPVLRRWDHMTVRDSGGRARHVGLSVAGAVLDAWPLTLAVCAVGALLLCGAPWLLRAALAPYRLLVRGLLGPSRAQRRIRDLEETRALAVQGADATLRRIERDLHDGTQARLVGLGMQLTLIRELLAAGAGTDRLLAVVDTARESTKTAVAELRALVRGIHPPVLDSGLETALASLAAGSALPVALRVDIARRPAPAVESIAYFCAAELLTNAVRHSGARGVRLDLRRERELLRLTVHDDGRGGARPAAGVGAGGTGLSGLRARVRAVDGTMVVSSPEGGPTVVTVTLPC